MTEPTDVTDGVDPDTVRAVFKAYDVRGLAPEQIDEPLARATGRAHAQVTGSATTSAASSRNSSTRSSRAPPAPPSSRSSVPR